MDADKVMKVVDDPNWTFDWFGEQTRMGGKETYGIRRFIAIYESYSE